MSIPNDNEIWPSTTLLCFLWITSSSTLIPICGWNKRKQQLSSNQMSDPKMETKMGLEIYGNKNGIIIIWKQKWCFPIYKYGGNHIRWALQALVDFHIPLLCLLQLLLVGQPINAWKKEEQITNRYQPLSIKILTVQYWYFNKYRSIISANTRLYHQYRYRKSQ